MKGWKTITFNVITGILLVVENTGAAFGLSNEIIAAAALVGNFVLRFLTDTAVFSSVPGGGPKKPQ